MLSELADSVRLVNQRFQNPLPPVTFGQLATIPEGGKPPEEFDLTRGEEQTQWFDLDADDGMSVVSAGVAPSERSSSSTAPATEASWILQEQCSVGGSEVGSAVGGPQWVYAGGRWHKTLPPVEPVPPSQGSESS